MGRKPSVNLNLPRGMRARKRGKNIYYYYDMGGKPRKEIPLGKDYIAAVQEWSKLEMAKIPRFAEATFATVALRYENEVIPAKAIKTQKENLSQLKRLREFFVGTNPAPLNEIEPEHIKQYMEWRKQAPVAANREIALFSHIWTMASPAYWNYTNKPCPAKGIQRNKEKRREVYVEDYIYELLYDLAEQDIKDAMEIAYLIGQRPADTLKIQAHHIRDGILSVKQNKTQAQLRFEISGRIKEIIERRLKSGNIYLFTSKRGARLTVNAFSKRFNKLREKAIALHPELEPELRESQFRDLRAKSGTDAFLKSGSVEAAQMQLGHTTPTTTRVYIRRGKVLKPLE